MSAISAWVWWSSRSSTAATTWGGVLRSSQAGLSVGRVRVWFWPPGSRAWQVAAAGQLGVVAGAFDGGGAELVGLEGAVFEFGGDGEGGLDGQWGEGVDEQRADGGVDAGAGDGLAVGAVVLDLVLLADVGGQF